MDIAVPHHQMLLGENGANVRRIMLQSGTTICFPNPLVAVVHRQNTVQVTGQLSNVLHARQLLLVSLKYSVISPDVCSLFTNVSGYQSCDNLGGVLQ